MICAEMPYAAARDGLLPQQFERISRTRVSGLGVDGFSALAQIKWRLANNRILDTPRFAQDMIVAVISVVFSSLFVVDRPRSGPGLPVTPPPDASVSA
jgi:basic amino acid/polyamine antiporter, APA family